MSSYVVEFHAKFGSESWSFESDFVDFVVALFLFLKASVSCSSACTQGRTTGPAQCIARPLLAARSLTCSWQAAPAVLRFFLLVRRGRPSNRSRVLPAPEQRSV